MIYVKCLGCHLERAIRDSVRENKQTNMMIANIHRVLMMCQALSPLHSLKTL